MCRPACSTELSSSPLTSARRSVIGETLWSSNVQMFTKTIKEMVEHVEHETEVHVRLIPDPELNLDVEL